MKTFVKTSVFLGVLLLVVRTGVAGPQEVYDKAIRSVVWIVNLNSDGNASVGSGVVVDRSRGLIVTCYHVSEPADEVKVFFPYRDGSGHLQSDQKYYVRNYNELSRTGYAAAGRVIARDKVKDLAVLRVEKLPEETRSISLAKEDPQPNDMLQAIGNPGINPNLWRSALGSLNAIGQCQRTYEGGHRVNVMALFFYSDIVGGYSGGPVLDSNGRLVGICHAVKTAEGGIDATAIHYREIKAILATVETQQVFSVRNRTDREVRCRVRWGQSEWEEIVLRPGERRVLTATAGEPEVRFYADGRQARRYSLECSNLSFGKGYDPNPKTEARAYCFQLDGREMDLFAEK